MRHTTFIRRSLVVQVHWSGQAQWGPESMIFEVRWGDYYQPCIASHRIASHRSSSFVASSVFRRCERSIRAWFIAHGFRDSSHTVQNLCVGFLFLRSKSFCFGWSANHCRMNHQPKIILFGVCVLLFFVCGLASIVGQLLCFIYRSWSRHVMEGQHRVDRQNESLRVWYLRSVFIRSSIIIVHRSCWSITIINQLENNGRHLASSGMEGQHRVDGHNERLRVWYSRCVPSSCLCRHRNSS